MPGSAARLALLARAVPMVVLALLARPESRAAATSAAAPAPSAPAAPVRRVLHPELRPEPVDTRSGGRGANGDASTSAPGSTAYRVALAGGPRSYVLHLPVGGVPDGPRPVVLVLPGLFTGAADVERASGFDAVSDTTGAVVVYAEGLKDSWNAGHCCGYAAGEGVDDVTALRGVVDAVETQVWIDRRKVVVAGFSNGGMLAYRFACERPREVAGIVVVSGALVTDGCAPSSPVAVVVNHGVDDKTVPETGQAASSLLHTFTASLAASIAPFVAVDRCELPQRTKRLPPFRVEYYRRCAAGVQVTVFRDDSLGHMWPGPTLGGRSFSATAYDLLADRRSPTEFR